MEPFLEAFFSVDTDLDEQIYVEDLEAYINQHHLDRGMLTRWKELFDTSGSGVITLTRFCDVLGLQEEKARIYRAESLKARAGILGYDIELIAQSMPEEKQVDICTEVRKLCGGGDTFDGKVVARSLKKYLDVKYGRMWHVVILTGTFCCSYSHDPSCSFHFRYKKQTFLIWRTTEA